jgi:outer membrane protein
MTKLGVVVGALLVAVVVTDAGAAGSKIAFFDLQKVVVRSVAGVAAREQLERESAPIKKDLETRRVEIEKLREELEKKGLVLAPDAKRDKEEVLQRKIRDMRRYAEDGEKEMQRKEALLRQKLIQELTALIDRFGKERGYLLIIEKAGGAVAYGDPEADISEELIKVYDQEKSKEKK